MGETAERLRGVSVGVVSTTLALAAHATGGGMLPDPLSLLLVVGVGTALGVAAGTLPWLRSARLGLLALLGVGQLAGHLLLGVTAMHPHVSPAPTMLAAHGVAVLATAALLALAEQVGPACTAALARVLPALVAPLQVRGHLATAPVSVTATTIRQLLVRTSLARRGPPVRA